ncbi:hypothetical protein EXU57_04570 [Segetibacter sp. 3557_3]|uniref:hypothetical protein n=1 Tax=Segetibacter sp. 3557_3 TaxID=2547429 RepID=UPI0010590A80|nr:hypothetical protein [Segetibacter sp. 3557_3]TDH27755.1 hypothetical protein EXU57_04570 [Segetibacter sp. 3557_3]
MKTHVSGSLCSMLKKLLAPAALMLLLSAMALPVAAADKNAKSDSPVEVKYLGQVDANPVFQVDINNDLEDDVYLSLKDLDGNVIYSEKFRDKKLSRKFQLQSHDGSNVMMVLNLYSKNKKGSETFEISNVTTVVEDLVVTKLR